MVDYSLLKIGILLPEFSAACTRKPVFSRKNKLGSYHRGREASTALFGG
jgi:hypothetical protein